jgi:glycosyltransferase involved in cell wall biosynthesis
MRPWGGAEVWFLETLEQLHRRGHRVSLVCQPGSELATRAGSLKLPFTEIPIRFDAAPWTLAKLHHHFRKNQVTAIVANLTKDLKAASVAGRLAGVPRIIATRESDFPLKDKLYYRWYFNRLATGMLVASEATRETVRQSAPWLDSEKIHLIYKGIDLNRFQPASIPAPDRQPTVGFLGQLISRKGVPQLMEAWSQVDTQSRGATLKMAGEGALSRDLETWRQGLKHPENVQLLGYVEDPVSFLREIDILAMPSSAEGFGLAAAEAGACGVPVIAGQASSLPEIVIHEETGLLVPPEDPGQLFAALRLLLDKPELARKLGDNAHQRVTSLFDREKTLDQLENLCGLKVSSGVSRGWEP